MPIAFEITMSAIAKVGTMLPATGCFKSAQSVSK